MILRKYSVFLYISVLFSQTPAFALGTYSEGWTVAKLTQFESRGIVYESYEGVIEVLTYDPAEECDETRDECYMPMRKKANVSVRPENADVVNFLMKNLNQTILIQFNIHRVQPIALSSSIEVVNAQYQENIIPHSTPVKDPSGRITVWVQAHDTSHPIDKMVTNKTGGKRNFSVMGRIVSLEYKGTIVGTYEGLYMDESRGRIHPFSITSEEMAEFAWKAMKYTGKYYLGVSVAYVTGVRESHYDIFEINFREPAGSQERPKK
ncbi:surface adhesion protein Lsa26 [Leptospira sp. SA-E8]|uniref:surface adhesion protein Lsa26 n=1 Tax=Leptospira sp. SA-E8 TaxID=3422259 RepID=UPI003EB976F7